MDTFDLFLHSDEWAGDYEEWLDAVKEAFDVDAFAEEYQQ